MSIENYMLSIALLVSHATQCMFKSIKPCSWRLFETIQGLLQFAHLPNCPKIRQTRSNLHVHFLLKITMQESILDVQLMQTPSKIRRKRNQNSRCAHLCHRCKRFIIVNVICLTIPPCKKSSFVSFNLTFTCLLHSEDPLSTNSFLSRR